MEPVINYFSLLNSEMIEIDSDDTVKINNKYLKERIINEINNETYYCIIPENLENIMMFVDENEHYKEFNSYLNDLYDDESIHNVKLKTIQSTLNEFSFFNFKLNNKQNIVIDKKINPLNLFKYWFTKNTFCITENYPFLRKLGITNKTINLLPQDHNYYGRNLICTCGQAGCDSSEVWIIKDNTNYIIPFIIDLRRRIYFNLQKFSEQYDWEEEDFTFENYSTRNSHNTFPFCFEYPDFIFSNNTIFSNEGIQLFKND